MALTDWQWCRERSDAMRLIYVDEAGTAGIEPIAVAIGIIVHADTQYMPNTSLNILHLLAHLLDRNFHLDCDTGGFQVLGFGSQCIRLAIKFLQ
jgi:hypothetical protein